MPRSPSTFEVIARRVQDAGGPIPVEDVAERSHGTFDTLDEARGCVEFDHLTDYEIWMGDHIVQEAGE